MEYRTKKVCEKQSADQHVKTGAWTELGNISQCYELSSSANLPCIAVL